MFPRQQPKKQSFPLFSSRSLDRFSLRSSVRRMLRAFVPSHRSFRWSQTGRPSGCEARFSARTSTFNCAPSPPSRASDDERKCQIAGGGSSREFLPKVLETVRGVRRVTAFDIDSSAIICSSQSPSDVFRFVLVGLLDEGCNQRRAPARALFGVDGKLCFLEWL